VKRSVALNSVSSGTCKFLTPRSKASARRVVTQFQSRRCGSSNPRLSCHRRNDRCIGNCDLPDSGNVLRIRKVCGPKGVCAQAAMATSRVSNAARNSGTRIGFGCFSVASGLRVRCSFLNRKMAAPACRLFVKCDLVRLRIVRRDACGRRCCGSMLTCRATALL
jgi:hypothetical protein